MRTLFDTEFDTKYVLFSDYALDERKALKTFRSHLPELKRLLCAPAHPGFLILFYKEGLIELLQKMDPHKKLDDYRSIPKVAAAEKLRRKMERIAARESGMKDRVRIITSIAIAELFGLLEDWDRLQKLFLWFAGPGTTIQYDTPKLDFIQSCGITNRVS
jgi:hypothetical protein